MRMLQIPNMPVKRKLGQRNIVSYVVLSSYAMDK